MEKINQFKEIKKSQQKITEEEILKESHLPIVDVDEEGKEIILDVRVGNVEHPSEQDHFIKWIELLDDETPITRIYLSHLNTPRTTFFVKNKINNLKIKAMCNIHGLWEYSDKEEEN